MMRVSHNPPSFFPPRVLVLLPAPARAARALSIQLGTIPSPCVSERGGESWEIGRIRPFTSCNPMTLREPTHRFVP